MLAKVKRLFVIKTRTEAFLIIYALAVGAIERGQHYMESYQGAGGWMLAAACTGSVFLAGAAILDGLKAKAELATQQGVMSEIIIDSGPRDLGRSGIHVGPIAWGVMRLEPDLRAARELFEVALESGYTLFDTADIYGRRIGGFGFVEDVMGQVFAESPGLRERIVLATKGGITPPVPYNSSAAYLESAIDASLKRLRTERVDLWQIHRPDVLTHPAEIARVVEKAHAQGKFQAFGVSNYTPAQVAALRGHLPHDVPLATSQPEFSPLHLGPLVDGTFDDALTHSAAILAWSPLAGGRLFAPENDRERAVAAALDAVAEAQGVSRATVAYSWLMAHPVRVIPIIGTQNPDRIREAADALKVVWTREEWYKVLTASRGKKLP